LCHETQLALSAWYPDYVDEFSGRGSSSSGTTNALKLLSFGIKSDRDSPAVALDGL
jgi:hypothetical protein